MDSREEKFPVKNGRTNSGKGNVISPVIWMQSHKRGKSSGGGYGGGSGHMTDKDWGQVVREDMRTLEDRLARQNELSEARINKAVDEIKEDFKDLKTEFKEVRADIKESKKYNLGILLTIVGMFITVIAFGVATLLSVASLVK